MCQSRQFGKEMKKPLFYSFANKHVFQKVRKQFGLEWYMIQ